jgi:hypothetical protein
MKINTFLSTVLIIAFAFLTNAHAITYEIEPNNDKDHANDLYNLIMSQEPIVGQLSSSSDNDYYSIHVSGSDVIKAQFETTSTPGHSYSWFVGIEDLSGNILAQKFHDPNQAPLKTEITAAVAIAGEFFVRVRAGGHGDVEYSLTISASHPIKPQDPNSVLSASFTGYGLYTWNGSAWTQINATIPANMVASGLDLYANFTGYGLYKWNGSVWIQLNAVSPANMVASGNNLYASFTGYGLYKWNGTTWSQLNAAVPEEMIASGTDLYANFTGYGLYKWDGSVWSQLNSTIPANMVMGF